MRAHEGSEAIARLGQTWAIVPFKGHGGKQRLATLLDEAERRELVRAMLADVIAALVACPLIHRVLVVSPEPSGPEVIDESRLSWLGESVLNGRVVHESGLNGALAVAQAAASAAGAARALIVPADLPLIVASDVNALLDALPSANDEEGGDARAVIAPDGAHGGTNALLLEPPTALEPSFGVDSFHAHVAWAAEAGLAYGIVRRPNLMLDIDTPQDVARFIEVATGGRTLAVLRSIDVRSRAACEATRDPADAAVRPGG